MFSAIKTKKLHRAAAAGDIEKMLSLVKKGADVNASSLLDGITALHLSARHGVFDGAEFLIRNGADVNAREKASETPLHWASGRGHAEVIRLLIRNGALLDARAGVFGETPLHEAAWAGHREAAEVLLEYGASAAAADWKGANPLHWACAGKGHARTIKLLIENGVQVNAPGGAMEETPLHAAARADNHAAAGILIDEGADTGLKDRDGRTPFETAVKFKSRMTADILRKNMSKNTPRT